MTGPATAMDRDRFEIFKNTQQGKLLSRFVLLAALRKPEVAKLPAGSGSTAGRRDAVDWLQKPLVGQLSGKGGNHGGEHPPL